MTLLEILQSARALLDRGWTTKTLARSANAIACQFGSPHATHFCLVGALRRSAQGLSLLSTDPGLPCCQSPLQPHVTDLYRATIERLTLNLGIPHEPIPEEDHCISLTRWNDMPGRTQAEVLDLIDRALLSLRPEEPPAKPGTQPEEENHGR